jgi:hypothetical protein
MSNRSREQDVIAIVKILAIVVVLIAILIAPFDRMMSSSGCSESVMRCDGPCPRAGTLGFNQHASPATVPSLASRHS